MKPDRNATVAEVYAHPLGRDIIDKMLLQTGRSAAWVRNPLVSRLRLRQLDKFLECRDSRASRTRQQSSCLSALYAPPAVQALASPH